MTNGERVALIRAELSKLPAPRAQFYKRRLATALQKTPLRIAGSTEWDLWLANELDRIYGAVATEATKTRKELIDATADGVSKVGWGIWPLAIAAVAIGWAMSKGRGA